MLTLLPAEKYIYIYEIYIIYIYMKKHVYIYNPNKALFGCTICCFCNPPNRRPAGISLG